MPIHVFTVISQHPEGPALATCLLLLIVMGGISQYGKCMAQCMQNSASLENKIVIQHCVLLKAKSIAILIGPLKILLPHCGICLHCKLTGLHLLPFC